MTTLRDAVALAHVDRGLAVVSTLRADNTIQASLVNAGVLPHPATAEPVLGFVTYGPVTAMFVAAGARVADVSVQWWTVRHRRPGHQLPDDPDVPAHDS